MKYSIDINMQGFKTVEIDSKEAIECIQSDIVLFLTSTSSRKLVKYYSSLKTILEPKKMNRVILLLDGNKSDIRKHICNLCVMMGNYDIYIVDGSDNLDDEYINTLIDRKPTLNEVQTFVSSDLSGYDRISEIVLNFSHLVEENDTEGLKELLADEKESLLKFPELIDFMKITVDNHNQGIETATNNVMEELEKLERQNKELSLRLIEQTEVGKSDKISIKALEEEVKEYKDRCKSLEVQSESEGLSGISQYRPIALSKIRGTVRVKCVLYFKEISKASYINTLVHFLDSAINGKTFDEMKCKTVVYDRYSDYLALYRDFTIVTGEKFHTNPNIINTDKNILITEPNMGITEALLKTDNDVIIIYDKLKGNDDLVEGNTVIKFYVINSSKDLNAIERAKNINIERESVITSYGACPDTLQVKTVEGFKGMTENAQFNIYNRMETVDKKKLFNTIFERAGLSQAQI